MNSKTSPNWTTQMDAARHGIVTRQMIAAAEREGLAPDTIRDRIAAGTVCLPANRNHASPSRPMRSWTCHQPARRSLSGAG